eukprot:snap_masked-scaffold_3-processed-gene-3.25-mRNA-1 protein AED:1.00 eAED:1.00 QI:0/-1/0/0/-1/1/1/0/94
MEMMKLKMLLVLLTLTRFTEEVNKIALNLTSFLWSYQRRFADVSEKTLVTAVLSIFCWIRCCLLEATSCVHTMEMCIIASLVAVVVVLRTLFAI